MKLFTQPIVSHEGNEPKHDAAKVNTASAIMLGLLPIMWSHGTGADVMKRIAAPMIGGMVTATFLTLLVFPAVYFIWKNQDIKNPFQKI